MSHGITMCSCGATISRCRCIDHTAVSVIPNGCERCKKNSTPKQGVLTAIHRPRQFEVVQYTAETKDIATAWIEGADNYVEDRPDPGDWVVKVMYPWGTNYEVDIYVNGAFQYWFELPA